MAPKCAMLAADGILTAASASMQSRGGSKAMLSARVAMLGCVTSITSELYYMYMVLVSNEKVQKLRNW